MIHSDGLSPFRGLNANGPASRQGEMVAVGEAVLPNLYHPVVVL